MVGMWPPLLKHGFAAFGRWDGLARAASRCFRIPLFGLFSGRPIAANASGLGGRCPFFTLKVFGFKPCAGAFFSLISKVLKIFT